MPTVLRIGPYRFSFFSKENSEPPHIHVARDRSRAKFWLEPESILESSNGFNGHELTTIQAMIESNKDVFMEAWRAHFGQH